MNWPTRVPGPRRLLGCCGREPRAAGGETPPEPETPPEQEHEHEQEQEQQQEQEQEPEQQQEQEQQQQEQQQQEQQQEQEQQQQQQEPEQQQEQEQQQQQQEQEQEQQQEQEPEQQQQQEQEPEQQQQQQQQQEQEQPEEPRAALPLGSGQALEECPLCLLPQPPEAFPRLGCCAHRCCRGCLQQYLRLAVGESRVPVPCPQCPAVLPPADVHRLLPEPALRDKYEQFLLRRLLLADPGTRWCPAPDCSYAVFAHGCAECPRLTCGREGCGTEFCYHCRQPWHPDGPCAPLPPSLATPTAQLAQPEELAHAEAEDIKVCPRCSALIMKINDGSCNRMNCPVCGCLFCWLCLREISDVHFLSPSGCTFWGKRPWSRTRRILWQLGMVLGAPMVISLAAGIAVPVITIGIPIYMGRKVLGQSRRSSLSGCQQCLSVTSSVLLSLFVSPIITALTVGVGVPLVLTYVYGTVVLSLCRGRRGCRGGRSPAELGVVELDNLAKLNELWAGLPSPRAAEDGAAGAAASVPSSSRSPRPGPAWPEGSSQSASTVALAGSMLSEGQDTSDRYHHRGGGVG
ncbi:E3 ubiquitin-protein ligase RNF19B-like isoform X2 [Prinia subflava]|uniref:E3 ubiquitin-protein ligase RNF19B-like isoform X2 n=1 Tax=Prinia subflava TaxID=208062 RepID=UPI002FE3AAE4